jgi:hypothetical protein
MTHTSFATIVLVIMACYLGAPDAAMAAEGKCTSVSAQCAVEIGGQCDPKTGHWCYGRYQGHNCGGSNIAAFDACVSRKLGQHK